jgi:hypothetical protein
LLPLTLHLDPQQHLALLLLLLLLDLPHSLQLLLE